MGDVKNWTKNSLVAADWVYVVQIQLCETIRANHVQSHDISAVQRDTIVEF